jgi:hypothetical protein
MGEEIELAAKATGAVVEALAEKSGALKPARAYAEAITSGIHYHFYPRVVKQAMAAEDQAIRFATQSICRDSGPATESDP